MAGTWADFNAPAGVNADLMLLLTDGSVLAHDGLRQDNAGNYASGGKNWYRLTPDSNGNYSSGTWSAGLPMANARQYFACGVTMDGRVYVIGGEDSDAFATDKCVLGEIFDPRTNLWGPMNKPSPQFDWIAGDVPGCMMADGRVLIGGNPFGVRSAIWDPATNLWVEAGLGFNPAGAQTKQGVCNEETWTLLRDGSVLTVEVSNPNNAEKYVPSLDQWVPASATGQTLPVASVAGTNVSEIGPAILLPDGRVFAIGGSGHTALYTNGANPGDPGSWANGPDFPADAGNPLAPAGLFTVFDAAGCLLPGGRVICIAGRTTSLGAGANISYWSSPSTFFEYDPNNAGSPLTQLANQPDTGTSFTYASALLVLPNGHILYASSQQAIAEYTPDASELAFNASWKPTITACPSAMIVGHTYTITGTQLNGLSQANSYGDDQQMATNYPLVRLSNGAGNVAYLRSFNFSTLGVATGGAAVSTSVEVTGNVTPGLWNLVVVANGIPSDPVAVTIGTRDCYLIVDRNTVSKGEIDGLIALRGAPAAVDPALYVVVEGFTPMDLGGLNPGNLSSPPIKPSFPNPDPKISVQFTGAVQPEDPTMPPNTPQRFTFPYKLVFQDDTPFNFGGASHDLLVTASMNAAGSPVSNSATITLLQNPDPYILHGDTAHGKPWYLSVDIKVFQVNEGVGKFGATWAPGGTAQAKATGFVTQMIQNLNTDPAALGPEFDALPPEEDAASLTLAPTTGGGTPVYNFALARVHFRDLNQDATNVRLFFRMWPAQQTNATYNSSTLYRSRINGEGKPIAVLGVQGDEIMTIPFFASPRVDTTTVSMATQTDDANNQPVIHHDPFGGEVDAYYGCWLDINQPNDQRFPDRLLGGNPANIPDGPYQGMGPLFPVQQLIKSAHQCLLAEISMDGLTIPANVDPSTSDKLAQRNLAFVNVPNPGVLSSRIAPQTFEIRPSPLVLQLDGKPDELMIDWGATPKDGVATFYLPGADAAETLNWANNLYLTHRLTMVDAHTIQCPVGGVTYIPIPQGGAKNFAGLMSVDLPPTIHKGQVYKIVVRQLTSKIRRLGNGQTGFAPNATAVAKRDFFAWRRVLGVFQLTIPVSTRQALLPEEERFYSILLWMQKAIPVESRWYPVFQRYVEQIGGRVKGMGGDPSKIPPTGTGNWQHGGKGGGGGHRPKSEEFLEVVGKVGGLVYSAKGDFEGFVMETRECAEYYVKSSERRVEELARRAWLDRSVVAVFVEHHEPHCLERIVVGGMPPWPECC
jgi:hypothetical protein